MRACGEREVRAERAKLRAQLRQAELEALLLERETQLSAERQARAQQHDLTQAAGAQLNVRAPSCSLPASPCCTAMRGCACFSKPWVRIAITAHCSHPCCTILALLHVQLASSTVAKEQMGILRATLASQQETACTWAAAAHACVADLPTPGPALSTFLEQLERATRACVQRC